MEGLLSHRTWKTRGLLRDHQKIWDGSSSWGSVSAPCLRQSQLWDQPCSARTQGITGTCTNLL